MIFQAKSFLVVTIFFSIINSNCNAQVQTSTQKNSVYTYTKGSVDGIGKYYQGREIAQVMGASGSEWLERSSRQQEEHSDEAIDSMPLHANSIVADVGAGTGYYTFKIAKKVTNGKVFAVDVQDEMIAQLENKKRLLQAKNVEVIKSTDSSANLPENAIDLAIMVDVYHELEYPHEILQSIYKALKPTGKLLLLEYRAEDASIPIKPLHKLGVAQANKELAANGFILFQRKEFLPIQHYLLYKKAAK